MPNDATGMCTICIHLRRYPYTVNSNSGSTTASTAYQSCGMDTTFDFALQVQILDGHIANIAEKRTSFTIIAINVNRHRMTITVESATIGGI